MADSGSEPRSGGEHRPEISADLWAVLTNEPSVGISIVNLQGRVLYANEQALRMYSREEPLTLENLTLDEVFPPEAVAERIEVLRRVVRERKPIMLRHIRRGRRMEATLWPTGYDGEDESQLGVLAISRWGMTPGAEERFEVVESAYSDYGALSVLTPREMEVLALVGQGLSVPEIARLMHRSPKTIEQHKSAVARKLRARNAVELARIAFDAGLEVKDIANPEF